METYCEVPTAQTKKCSQAVGQAARWPGLLYGDRKEPVPCSKSALDVELRGFEPLTPSMRTQCSTGPTSQITASAQVSGLRTATITASDAASPSLAAPIPLPKSDSARAHAASIDCRQARRCLWGHRELSPRRSDSGYTDGQHHREWSRRSRRTCAEPQLCIPRAEHDGIALQPTQAWMIGAASQILGRCR
jgi:hypothetical protein